MSLVIIGSVAFDTIATPKTRKERIVGGSGTYSSLAACYFTNPRLVSVVGDDFPQETIALLQKKGIDTRGLEVRTGKTFFWEGSYGHDPNQRETIKTEVNVFQDFSPKLLPEYQRSEIVFLGNIDPDLQEGILQQLQDPKLVAMDTISLWINTKRDALLRTLEKVDIFFANDEEIRLLTGERNLIKASKKLLEKNPFLVVAKKGEHGALLIGTEFVFCAVSYLCDEVVDPTGAGDTFAGGFLGYMDSVGNFDASHLRKAAVYGTVMASFVIEDFGIERLKNLTLSDIEERFEKLQDLVLF